MNYTQIIKDLGLAYGDWEVTFSDETDRYGIYYGRFLWFDKSGFRDFVLYYLPGFTFQLADVPPDTLESALHKYFGTPEKAHQILRELRELSEKVLDADHGFDSITDYIYLFLNTDPETFLPKKGIFWMGKIKDLATEEYYIARENREMYNGSPDPIPDGQIPAFLEFMDDLSYLYEIQENYEIAKEFHGEIITMRAEPGYDFPTAEEILQEVKEFAADMQDQPNIIRIIEKIFPALD